MERSVYDVLVGEVFSELDIGAVSRCMERDKTGMRVDGVIDLLRGALLRSSICKFNGVLHFFNGKIYERMSFDDFGNVVYDVLRRCCLPDGDYSRVESMLRVLYRVVSGKEISVSPNLVVFNNCVFDTDDGNVYGFSRDLHQVTCVGYDYDESASCLGWMGFLDMVLPDGTMQMVLQEFLGSIFVDRKRFKVETLMILKGSGSNGKSVVFDTIMGILGSENVSNFGIGALIGGSERKRNIAFMNGKRLNYCSEIQTLEFGTGSDALKALVSGEPVEARVLYGDNFTARDIPLIMANANSLPSMTDTSYGMRRRICVVPFDVEIPISAQKHDLSSDLRCEYAGIFNWIMEGKRRFIENGYRLTRSSVIEAIMDEYQSEGNNVIRFMLCKDFMRNDSPDDRLTEVVISSSDLYSSYCNWCDEVGERCFNVTSFGKVLTSAGYTRSRGKDGVIYVVYTASGIGKMHAQQRRFDTVDRAKDNEGICVIGGKRYAYGRMALSRVLKISNKSVENAFRNRQLEGLYTTDGNFAVFDVDACRDFFASVGVYGKTREQLKALEEKERKLREMRVNFNNEMAMRGLKLRKGKVGKSSGMIVVPDDWVYTLESAQKLYDDHEKLLDALRYEWEDQQRERIERILSGKESFVNVKTDPTGYFASMGDEDAWRKLNSRKDKNGGKGRKERKAEFYRDILDKAKRSVASRGFIDFGNSVDDDCGDDSDVVDDDGC